MLHAYHNDTHDGVITTQEQYHFETDIKRYMAQISAAVKDITDHPGFEKIPQTQQERLFHIEFRLQFLGCVNRTDLVSRFGIKEAAASRDLSAYKQHAPNNLEYDAKEKKYFPGKSFKPIFEHETFQALSAIQYGFGDDFVGVPTSLITAETPTRLNYPNLDTLSKITKAIYQKKILRAEYHSLSSGNTKREIAPFALVNNGLRWHVRAFDRQSAQFRDFVINRFASLALTEQDIEASESRDSDNQWNRIVEMHIVPHPSLKHPKTIEIEYAMIDRMLKIDVRAAVAGYVLRHWNVDCSENHSLDESEAHLWLKNHQTLYGVDNLSIAPGYASNRGVSS